jgi:hypothetical protein
MVGGTARRHGPHVISHSRTCAYKNLRTRLRQPAVRKPSERCNHHHGGPQLRTPPDRVRPSRRSRLAHENHGSLRSRGIQVTIAARSLPSGPFPASSLADNNSRRGHCVAGGVLLAMCLPLAEACARLCAGVDAVDGQVASLTGALPRGEPSSIQSCPLCDGAMVIAPFFTSLSFPTTCARCPYGSRSCGLAG